MTITENINRIKQAKEDIKEAIIAKGVEVADDVRIDGYAEKIGEIKQGGGGQFAIDYGEEIYTNNAYSMTAEQEDIDYYNQIQAERAAYAAGTGGRSDYEIRTDLEFQRKIAWWPKGMDVVFNTIQKCINIREFPKNAGKVQYNTLNTFKHLYRLTNEEVDTSVVTNTSLMLNRGSCDLINLSFPSVTTNIGNFLQYMIVQDVKLSFENFTGSFSGCNYLKGVKRIEIFAPLAKSIGTLLRDVGYVDTIIVDISSAISETFFLYGGTNPKELFIKGLMFTVSLSSKDRITTDSIKYILDNCQARADGAAYTLTLHADVKEAFMAKCTEGDENYDAEYAATLAAANAKGLTIA